VPLYGGQLAAEWARLRSAAPVAAIVVMNAGTPGGPGRARDESYASAIEAAQRVGQRVLGYVHSEYSRRLVSSVRREIDRWYAMYPSLNGIFVDQVTPDGAGVTYYGALHDAIKTRSRHALVVINPGLDPTEEYLTVGDIVVSFEGTYETYAGSASAGPAWVQRYPASRFWHIITEARSEQSVRDAVRLSRQRNAGHVFMSDLPAAEAYLRLPAEPYWAHEIAAVTAHDGADGSSRRG
jgi:hypothetical protein